jgi:hypothetical protein
LEVGELGKKGENGEGIREKEGGKEGRGGYIQKQLIAGGAAAPLPSDTDHYPRPNLRRK